eukprot:RCo008044
MSAVEVAERRLPSNPSTPDSSVGASVQAAGLRLPSVISCKVVSPTQAVMMSIPTTLSFPELQRQIAANMDLGASQGTSFSLKWADGDGDRISLRNPADWAQLLLWVSRQGTDPSPVVRLFLSASISPSLSEQQDPPPAPSTPQRPPLVSASFSTATPSDLAHAGASISEPATPDLHGGASSSSLVTPYSTAPPFPLRRGRE